MIDTATPTGTQAGTPHGTTVRPAARAEMAVKVYGRDGTEVRALDGVSIDIPAGRFTAVMGPSGSGKSTLMHCLAGLDTLTSGRVFIGDVDLEQRCRTASSPRCAASTSASCSSRSTCCRRCRRSRTSRCRWISPVPSPTRPWLQHVIDTVGLRDRLKHRPSELSGGQQQRVAVARALAGRPQVIFADEPTGNLDSRTGGEILGFMRRAVDQFGQTIVMVTHDPVAASYADAVVFLADGRIVDSLVVARPRPACSIV